MENIKSQKIKKEEIETKSFIPIHMKNINEQYTLKHMKSHLFNKIKGLHKRKINHHKYMADSFAEYKRFGKNLTEKRIHQIKEIQYFCFNFINCMETAHLDEIKALQNKIYDLKQDIRIKKLQNDINKLKDEIEITKAIIQKIVKT